MATTNPIFLIFYFLMFFLRSNSSSAATYIVREGAYGATVTNLSAWATSHPVHVGDTLLFRLSPQRQNVYIFHRRKALESCNFTEATLLERDNNGYFKWLATRVGVFYFSYNKAVNGSTSHCSMARKIAVIVRRQIHSKFHSRSPKLPPFYAPSPRHHGPEPSNHASSLARAPSIPPSSPPNFSPRRDGFCRSASLAPTPQVVMSDSVAGLPPLPVPLPVVPDSAGGIPPSLVPMPPVMQDPYAGVPFVISNPALPLPKGETDSAAIRPLPTSDAEGQVVGWSGTQMLLMVLMLCFSFTL